MLKNYTRVRLLTDNYQLQSATRGALGYIIEIYPNGAHEVEFSDANGITFAQIIAQENELQKEEPSFPESNPVSGITSMDTVYFNPHQPQKDLTRSNKK